ncbi:hypothetical protein T02_1095 [Trichinella nativa]|uniref:Uncharacterized protein n=1 Tax=Trichinella nativa TaxID=6335 RepID=A0A0V1KH68_9BILA|nr:hypothetical protein T02_1095 [Trichinella nativa]
MNSIYSPPQKRSLSSNQKNFDETSSGIFHKNT